MGASCSNAADVKNTVNSKKKEEPSLDKYIRYPDEFCANDFKNPGYDTLY